MSGKEHRGRKGRLIGPNPELGSRPNSEPVGTKQKGELKACLAAILVLHNLEGFFSKVKGMKSVDTLKMIMEATSRVTSK